MKMGFELIGGKADGDFYPARCVTIKVDGETYISIDVKGEGFLYMLTGMTPAAALGIWRGRRLDEARRESTLRE